jgi:NitT/TauT family transport system ATP-binding protein
METNSPVPLVPSPASDDASVARGNAGIGVALHGVRRVFATGVEAVAPLDLSIEAGSFVAFLGPSGCGKSTLLRMIAGLDQPNAGSISFSGGPKRASVAFVFQDPHLMPWRRVLDNAALPLELAGVGERDRHARALAALGEVGLADAATRFPRELSGGMRMRVSLARALVTEPDLLLLDEPFAALDELTRHRLDDQLRALWKKRGMTVLFVTHALGEASYLAERAIVFSKRPARVVADRSLGLPSNRDFSIRSTPAFVAEEQALYEALVRGEES